MVYTSSASLTPQHHRAEILTSASFSGTAICCATVCRVRATVYSTSSAVLTSSSIQSSSPTPRGKGSPGWTQLEWSSTRLYNTEALESLILSLIPWTVLSTLEIRSLSMSILSKNWSLRMVPYPLWRGVVKSFLLTIQQ